jgi:hypothetical protein
MGNPVGDIGYPIPAEMEAGEGLILDEIATNALWRVLEAGILQYHARWQLRWNIWIVWMPVHDSRLVCPNLV